MTLAAVAVALSITSPAFAERSLDELMAELALPEAQDVEGLVNEVTRRWAQSGSSSVDFLLKRGQAAVNQNNLIRAVEHFTAAIDHDPDFAEAYNGRATAYYLMGEFGLSMGDIAQALSRNPDHFGALGGMGLILEEIGQERQAYEVYLRAQQINPHQDRINEAVDRLSAIGQGTAL